MHGNEAAVITLDFDRRTRSRLKAALDDGREAALDLERGVVLRDGDLLRADDGLVVRVCAAPEDVSAVYTNDALLMSRLCYHLGNRHVALEIADGRVAYQNDHVLDELVRFLGAEVVAEHAPFQPEGGAYGYTHGHSHGH